MAKIGILGAGNIGKQIARLAATHGHHVLLSNSRGPQNLPFDIILELGQNVTRSTAQETVAESDLLVVAIPLANYTQIPQPPAGKIVIDAGNYYPDRDGLIPELEEERTTTSELLQTHLPQARVVKAFNHIPALALTADAQPPGSQNRRALIVAGDDPEARMTVATLVDEFGFDPLDIGQLAEGWRVERGTPGYLPRFTKTELTHKVHEAKRYRTH
ncbi:NADPH-dependent F420 reductase [Streptomyces sp. NBC_00038]|nr:NADPH-dependent F420 reductase [Streptomyces sp. NBC_00038]